MVMIDFRLFRQLWYFLALAEERHFGRAAKRLGISQPPLTQQIQILEQTLKVKLFERSRSQTTLTPQGLAILPAVQRLAEQAARLESIVLDARHGSAEQVTIGAINSAIIGLLPAVIHDARKSFPKASIALTELDSSTAWARLLSKEIDIAFGRYDRGTDQVKVVQLGHDQLDAAIPAHHDLARRDVIRLADLKDESWVMLNRHASPAYFDSVTMACRREGFSPRVSHHVSSQHSQIAFVVCGYGVALVPRAQAITYPSGVVFKPLVENLEIATASVAWIAETPVIRAIVELSRGKRPRDHQVSQAVDG